MYFRKRVVIQFVSIQFLIAKRKEKSPKKKKRNTLRRSLFNFYRFSNSDNDFIIYNYNCTKILQFLQIRFTKYKLEIKNRERLKTTA